MSTLTAERKIRMSNSSIRSRCIPEPSARMLEALEDVRLGRNLNGPYATVEEAMRAMLED